jgi:hypothetical protein
LFDINAYTKKLNDFICKACDTKSVIVRTSLSNQGGFYGILKNGEPSDVYDTKEDILKNMSDLTYNNIKDQRKYGKILHEVPGLKDQKLECGYCMPIGLIKFYEI